MDMYIQKYMSFVTAVESGSFTRAAERIGYSQSGISRMIADLEKEWQVKLLERSKGGVKLTAEGRVLLPYAKLLIRDFEKLQMQVDEIHGVQSGCIRIGTISSIATYWLPNMIAEFQKDHPKIEFEILMGHYTEIEDWIEEGRVDVGFLRLPTHKKFDAEVIEQDRLFVILPKNHPLQDEEYFPVKELVNDPFILLEKGAKEEISAIFDQNDLQPDIRFTTVDDYAAMSMVDKGLGISILPGLILKKNPFDVVIKELDISACRTLGYAVKDKEEESLAVKCFLEYISYKE